MEKDDEVKGEGNSYDFGARLFDSRVGRWLAVDPLAAEYVPISPYAFVANKPILYTDFDGRDIYDPKTGKIVKISTTDADDDPAFGRTEGSISVEGASDELRDLIIATWNQGPEGRATINKLREKDVKATVILTQKRGLFKNEKEKYGEILALGSGYTLTDKLGIVANNGYTKVYTIEVLAIDIEGKIEKNVITDDNINDFVLKENKMNTVVEKDLAKVLDKKQKEIITQVNESPATNAAEVASNNGLDPEVAKEYKKILNIDTGGDPNVQGEPLKVRRNVNSLIFETANAETQANLLTEKDLNDDTKVESAHTEGEKAGKKAVVKANE